MAAFLNGIARASSQAIHVLAEVPDTFVNGLPVSDEGQLCIDGVGAIVAYSNGIPLTAEGRVATSSDLTVGYSNGWPMDANGRVGTGVGTTVSVSNGLPFIANGHVNTSAVAP